MQRIKAVRLANDLISLNTVMHVLNVLNSASSPSSVGIGPIQSGRVEKG